MQTHSVIARIAGKTFVEHPVRGDEAPVQMLTDSGMIETPFWDMDEPHEVHLWVLEEAQ